MANFGDGSSGHSLRKGGVKFFAKFGAPEQASQGQGSWKSLDAMRNIYAKLTQTEVEQAIATTAQSAGLRTRALEVLEAMAGAGLQPDSHRVAAALPHLPQLPTLLRHIPVVQYKRPGFIVALKALAS